MDVSMVIKETEETIRNFTNYDVIMIPFFPDKSQ